MKLDLENFNNILNNMVSNKEITKDTATTYLSCMRVIEENCDVWDVHSLKKFLSSHIKTQPNFYKYLSAIRMYEEKVLNNPRAILYGEPEIDLVKKFKAKIDMREKKISVSIDTTNRKINALKNEKLKYALRLQLRSGLRISEISRLEKNDLSFQDGKITIHVKEGKGRKDRIVEVLEDDYLYKRLQDYIEKCPDKKLFYHKNYMSNKAQELGIKTHDLRRINARQRLQKEMKQGKTRVEAKKVVKKELGHEDIKITDMYLRYKIKK